MFLSTSQISGASPSCRSVPVPDDANYPNPVFVTPKPSPSQTPPFILGNGRQPTDSYQDNAPGMFTIFKFILFGLLIASPCLRLFHQWWSGGGRIRLRRSEESGSNRVVGLQYIPPMDNWFGMTLESTEVPRPPDRLTYQQIMSLPEIRYTKPIHRDEKINNTQTIEEEVNSPGNSNNNETNNPSDITNNTQIVGSLAETKEISVGEDDLDQDNSVVSEASFENETSVRLELPISPLLISRSSTSLVSPRVIVRIEEVPADEVRPEEQQQEQPAVGEGLDRDESIGSEVSFENEPSVRLELPTSPLRVLSTSATQVSNPLSPRTIVRTEEVQPDEERPEEVPPDEEEQEVPDVQEPTLVPSTPRSVQRQLLLLQEQEQEQCLHQEGSDGDAPPLSFRTQRRLQNFTTTTCTTCSICIDEFEEGETIRLLPRCGHAFHTQCILPWLQDRQGCCPLCKTEVLDPGPVDGSGNEEGNRASRATI